MGIVLHQKRWRGGKERTIAPLLIFDQNTTETKICRYYTWKESWKLGYCSHTSFFGDEGCFVGPIKKLSSRILYRNCVMKPEGGSINRKLDFFPCIKARSRIACIWICVRPHMKLRSSRTPVPALWARMNGYLNLNRCFDVRCFLRPGPKYITELCVHEFAGISSAKSVRAKEQNIEEDAQSDEHMERTYERIPLDHSSPSKMKGWFFKMWIRTEKAVAFIIQKMKKARYHDLRNIKLTDTVICCGKDSQIVSEKCTEDSAE